MNEIVMSESRATVVESMPVDPVRKAAEAVKRQRLARVVELGIVIAFVVLLLIGVTSVSGFTSAQNIRAILTDSAFLGIVAVGMTFVVVSGNYIDLSVVAQIATSAVIVTVLEPHGLVLAIGVAVLVNLGFAAANGLGVGIMKANGVVVTLAVQTAGIGLLEHFTQGAQFTGQSSVLQAVATASAGPIPSVFVILVVVAAIGQAVLSRTNIGLSVRAVGSSRDAARIAGVRTARSVFAAFAISSVCCALVGILLAGFNNNALPSMGQGFDFNALAAVIIGGTSLFGGRGNVLHTLVGVLFIGVLLNMLVIAGLPFEWQQLVKGLIIVAAVAGDALLRRRGLR